MDRDQRSPRPSIAALIAAVGFVAMGLPARDASAEGSRTGGVIRLEEITLIDIIPVPSVFVQLGGPGKVSPPAPVGARSDRPEASAGYQAAFESWEKMVEVRQRIEALAKARRNESRGARGTTGRSLPILGQIRGTSSESGDLPEITVVALAGGAGVLDPVQETLLQARGALERCSTSARLVIEVAPDGQVTAVRSESTEADCLAGVIQRLRFSAQPGNSSSYAIFFQPHSEATELESEARGDEDRRLAASVRRSPPLDRPGQEIPSGNLSSNIVRLILSRSMASIRACFLRGRRDDHDLQGRTTVSFVIAARGRVSAADVEESSLPPEVGACIVRQVRSLRFPPPEGGVVPFSSTFSFF